jgi:DNA-binding IclR family transcriptional regulator
VAVAAPIRDASGRVVAAINVSAPKFRLGRRVSATGELVRAAAAQLSARFGTPAIQGVEELAQ